MLFRFLRFVPVLYIFLFLLSQNTFADTAYANPTGDLNRLTSTLTTCSSTTAASCLFETTRSPSLPSTTGDYFTLATGTSQSMTATNLPSGTYSNLTLYVYHKESATNTYLTATISVGNSTATINQISRASALWDSSSVSVNTTQPSSINYVFSCAKVGGGKGGVCTVYAAYTEITYTPPPAISISLATDGVVNFGNIGTGESKNTTSTGINKVQTISVDSGTVSLTTRSTVFTDINSHQLSLSSTPGTDTVQWQFSPNGTSWNTFLLPDTSYNLATNLSAGITQPIFFRFFSPTSTSTFTTHSATVTITATSP